MFKNRYLLSLVVTLLAIIAMSFFGPEEKTLGESVRIVYIHGAWVLTAEIAFFLAALAGLVGLIGQWNRFQGSSFGRRAQHWSRALGWTGMVFWITYLPLSLWAMQANWSGLFLSEPRFRLALTFAVVGLLLQIGLWLVNRLWLTSLSNLFFLIALWLTFASAEYVMHPPPSPIFNSGNVGIQLFFASLNLLVLVAAYFLAGYFLTQTSDR